MTRLLNYLLALLLGASVAWWVANRQADEKWNELAGRYEKCRVLTVDIPPCPKCASGVAGR